MQLEEKTEPMFPTSRTPRFELDLRFTGMFDYATKAETISERSECVLITENGAIPGLNSGAEKIYTKA